MAETTPLLPATSHTQDHFPPITFAAQRLPPEPSLLDFQDSDASPLDQSQPWRAVAFRLLLVLHLLVSDHNQYRVSRRQSALQTIRDAREQDSRRENLCRIASAILLLIPHAIDRGLPGATESSPRDVSVEHILLASFTKDVMGHQKIRVIDLLAHPAVPTEILSDPIISLPLIRLWKYGRAFLDSLPSGLYFRRTSGIFDAASTPRAVHAVHITAHLAYLVHLAHLTLYPVPRPIFLETPGGPIGFREPIVALYSISNIVFNPFCYSVFSHALVLLSLLVSLPGSPPPDAFAYSLLILALCLHILFIQFPSYPAMPLLFEPTRWFPLSSLYVACVAQFLFPAFLSLLPALLASTLLLSLSLSGPTINEQTIRSTATAPPSAFLALFCIGCLLFLYLSISTLLLSPSPFTKDENQWNWQRYGGGAGIAGRRFLVRAILAYSPSRQPFNLAYPPPLNILSIPLTMLPLLPREAYAFFYRLVVGPFAVIAAGLWGWGLV